MRLIKLIVVSCVFSVQMYAFAKADSGSEAHVKNVSVNGMVCSFCSSSLEKKFKKKKEISDIKVDLDKQNVQLVFKKGQKISDENIRKIIKSSGFDVVDIQ